MTEVVTGWILYDGKCALCARWLARVYRPLSRRGFRFAPLQAPWVAERFRLETAGLLREMRLVTRGGRTFGGADAVAELARRVWWAWPTWLLYQVPGLPTICRAAYRWVARNRHCAGGACRISDGPRATPDHRVSSSFYDWP